MATTGHIGSEAGPMPAIMWEQRPVCCALCIDRSETVIGSCIYSCD